MPQCPVCGKPSDAKQKPFCSSRCRDVDLNRWFVGAYASPAVEMDDIDPAELDALLAEQNEDKL